MSDFHAFARRTFNRMADQLDIPRPYLDRKWSVRPMPHANIHGAVPGDTYIIGTRRVLASQLRAALAEVEDGTAIHAALISAMAACMTLVNELADARAKLSELETRLQSPLAIDNPGADDAITAFVSSCLDIVHEADPGAALNFDPLGGDDLARCLIATIREAHKADMMRTAADPAAGAADG